MRLLKKTMLEAKTKLPRWSEEHVLSLPNVSLLYLYLYKLQCSDRTVRLVRNSNICLSQTGSSTSECDLGTEIKQESDVELIDENEDKEDFISSASSESNQILSNSEYVQSFSPIVDEIRSGPAKDKELSFSSGSGNRKERANNQLRRNGAGCTMVFVDTNALVTTVSIQDGGVKSVLYFLC